MDALADAVKILQPEFLKVKEFMRLQRNLEKREKSNLACFSQVECITHLLKEFEVKALMMKMINVGFFSCLPLKLTRGQRFPCVKQWSNS